MVVKDKMSKQAKQLQEPFAAALNFFTDKLTRQKPFHTKNWLAKKLGVSHTYIHMLAKEERYGSEDIRISISEIFGFNYRDFINLGRNLLGEPISRDRDNNEVYLNEILEVKKMIEIINYQRKSIMDLNKRLSEKEKIIANLEHKLKLFKKVNP